MVFNGLCVLFAANQRTAPIDIMKKQKLPRTCEFCGHGFSATRSDTRFCCDNHRIAYFRWRTKLTALEIRAHHLLANIGDYLDFPDANRAALGVLLGLNEATSALIENKKKKDQPS